MLKKGGLAVDIKFVVATHKEYRMPSSSLYIPVQAGAALHQPLPYIGDNTGDHISEKNRNYCELTCLYWAWKNLTADYLGLCHYRRYFGLHSGKDLWSSVLTQEQAERFMKKAPVLLPKKRNYFIETNYTQYIHAHNEQDLIVTRAILAETFPAYLPAFDDVMRSTIGHRFNMFLMRFDLLDAYCSWLFPVLSALEERLDISGYSENDSRVFGFVAERLLDVWVETNHIDYQECAVLHMESQHWLKKGTAFLSRKFIRQKK
jgi:hypothetical protein